MRYEFPWPPKGAVPEREGALANAGAGEAWLSGRLPLDSDERGSA